MNCSLKKIIIKRIEEIKAISNFKSKDIELLFSDIPIFTDEEFNKIIPLIIEESISKKRLPSLISIIIYSLEENSIIKTKNLNKIDKRVANLVYLFLKCLKEYIYSFKEDIYAKIIKKEDIDELENALIFWKKLISYKNKGVF